MTLKIGDAVYHHSTCRGGTVIGSKRIAGAPDDWARVRFIGCESLIHPRELVSMAAIRVEAGVAIDAAMRAASGTYAAIIPPAIGLMLANVALTVLQGLDAAQRAALFEACAQCGATTEAECRGSDLPAAYTADEQLREQRTGRGGC